MKARIALLAAPLVLLAACSGDDTTIYTLSTGTYAVSGATVGTATPGDQCNLLASYTKLDKSIGIDVNGTTADFRLVLDDAPITQPSATINGNAIETPVEASYTANYGNCLVRVRRTVVGELTANDAAALQLHAQIMIETDGTDCDGTPYVGAGCESDIHFLATKIP
jgi:hypothetical protein